MYRVIKIFNILHACVYMYVYKSHTYNTCILWDNISREYVIYFDILWYIIYITYVSYFSIWHYVCYISYFQILNYFCVGGSHQKCSGITSSSVLRKHIWSAWGPKAVPRIEDPIIISQTLLNYDIITMLFAYFT